MENLEWTSQNLINLFQSLNPNVYLNVNNNNKDPFIGFIQWPLKSIKFIVISFPRPRLLLFNWQCHVLTNLSDLSSFGSGCWTEFLFWQEVKNFSPCSRVLSTHVDDLREMNGDVYSRVLSRKCRLKKMLKNVICWYIGEKMKWATGTFFFGKISEHERLIPRIIEKHVSSAFFGIENQIGQHYWPDSICSFRSFSSARTFLKLNLNWI